MRQKAFALVLCGLAVGCGNSENSDVAPQQAVDAEATDAMARSAQPQDASTTPDSATKDALPQDATVTSDGGTPGTTCSGKAFTASCAVVLSGPTTACTDYYGWDVNSAKLNCPSPNKVFKTTPCDTAATVGSCEQVNGSVCERDWTFSPFTTDMLRQACLPPAIFRAP